MSENNKNQSQAATMDLILEEMNKKVENLLRDFFVGKTLPGEPWSEEHFQVTMEVVVDATIENIDISDFKVNTSIEDHILFMKVQDEKENTVADIMYFVTKNEEDYLVDDVMVAFKIGPFLAIQEEVSDELPF